MLRLLFESSLCCHTGHTSTSQGKLTHKSHILTTRRGARLLRQRILFLVLLVNCYTGFLKVATPRGTITIDAHKTLKSLNFISLVHSSNALKLSFPLGLRTWTLVTVMVCQLVVLLVLPWARNAVLVGQGFRPKAHLFSLHIS